MSIAYDPDAVARAMGLSVLEANLPRGHRGEYWHGERLILLAPGMTYRERRSTLAHELQHAIAGDMPSPFGPVQRKAELLARRRTAHALIDVVEFAESERLRDGHLPSIARDLDVTTQVVADWLALRRTALVA